MTSDRLTELLETFKTQMIEVQKEKLDDLRLEFRALTQGGNATENSTGNEVGIFSDGRGGCTFCYGGKLNDVPKNFQFPKKIELKTALRFWICGMSVGTQNNYVNPFRFLQVTRLPSKKLQNEYKLHWAAVFNLLDSANIVVPRYSTWNNVPQDVIDEIYNSFTTYWWNTYKFCFIKNPNALLKWTLATWAARTRRSSVLKLGTEEDIAKLPPPSIRNNQNGRHNTQKRKLSESIRYPQ